MSSLLIFFPGGSISSGMVCSYRFLNVWYYEWPFVSYSTYSCRVQIQEEGKQTPPLDGTWQSHIAEEHNVVSNLLNNKIQKSKHTNIQTKPLFCCLILSNYCVPPLLFLAFKDTLLKLLGNHCISILWPFIQALTHSNVLFTSSLYKIALFKGHQTFKKSQ